MDLQELVASLSDEDNQALLALLAPAVVDEETEETEEVAGDETPEEEQAADEQVDEEEEPALDAAAIAADAMAKAIKHIDARNAMIALVHRISAVCLKLRRIAQRQLQCMRLVSWG